MNTEKTNLADRLKTVASQVGGGAALSRATGIIYSTLQGYLAGKYEPRVSEIVSIATATGVNLEWLLTGNGEMTPNNGGDEQENTDKSMGDSRSQSGLPEWGNPSATTMQAIAVILYQLLREKKLYQEFDAATFDKVLDLSYGIHMERVDEALAAGLEPPKPEIDRYRKIINRPK